MKTTKSGIISCVSNDLVVDQRVHKTAQSLLSAGFSIAIVGRELPDSKPILQRAYPVRRLKLLFRKGPAFYLELNIRLFVYLLQQRPGIILANDLDTLMAGFMAAKLTGARLVYDSHEYFSEVPELEEHPFKKRLWEFLERKLAPRTDRFYTVNESLAKIFSKNYQVDVGFIRNFPPWQEPQSALPTSNFNRKIILYQGSVNMGRGLESMIQSMQDLPGYTLWIVGSGDVIGDLKKMVDELGLNERVVFYGRIPFAQLREITVQASLGISLEENRGLNYYYALPNKLADYIHADLPVMVSDLPEMRNIVEQYQVGTVLSSGSPAEIARAVKIIFSNEAQYKQWQLNCRKAARELSWETEEARLVGYFTSL